MQDLYDWIFRQSPDHVGIPLKATGIVVGLVLAFALGALAIIVGVAFIPIYTVVWKDVGGGDYIDCIQKASNDRLQEQRCADQFRQNVQDKLSVTLTPTAVP